MAERVRSDLGFQPLYASLSFSEISTAVVYDTSTQQLFFGAISGSEGSYDIDFVANNIYLSSSLFAENGNITAQNFIGNLQTTIADGQIVFSDDNVLAGNSGFFYNQDTGNPQITIQGGSGAGQIARLIISGNRAAGVDINSGLPRISFTDTDTTLLESSSVLRLSGSIFEIYSNQGSGKVQFNPVSGSVSASGHLYASLSFDGTSITDNLVAYDTATGQLFLTNSLQPIDAANDNVIFKRQGLLTGSDTFQFTKLYNGATFEPTLRVRGVGQNQNIIVSSSLTGSLIAYGGDRGRLELRNSYDNNGNTNRFYIESYEIGTGQKPNTLRFSNAPGGNRGIHMRFSNGPVILAHALYAISESITPTSQSYYDGPWDPLPGGIVAEQISASYDITASTFFASGNLGGQQFIGTASWALNVTGSASYAESASYALSASEAVVTEKIKLSIASADAGFSIPVIENAANPTRLFRINGTDLKYNPVPNVLSVPNISASTDISGSYGYFTNNVTILGTASINYLHTIYESSSIIYSSGSTKFGDTDDDTHQRTGSMFISGATLTIPDGAITASIVSATLTPGVNLIGTASFATASVSASFAEFATSASYASSSTTASYALSASDATTASYALSASDATTASYALSASNAESASHATYALNVGRDPSYLFFTNSGVLFYDQPVVMTTINTSSQKGVTCDYNIYSPESGSRTGQFFATFFESRAEFTDTSTNHIGPEPNVPTFSASLDGIRLNVTIENAKGYTFKSYVKQF